MKDNQDKIGCCQAKDDVQKLDSSYKLLCSNHYSLMPLILQKLNEPFHDILQKAVLLSNYNFFTIYITYTLWLCIHRHFLHSHYWRYNVLLLLNSCIEKTDSYLWLNVLTCCLFFWPLHCLFLIHLRPLITALGSSNVFHRFNIYIAESPQRSFRPEPLLESEKIYIVYVPGLILCLHFPMRKIPRNILLLHHQDRDSISFSIFKERSMALIDPYTNLVKYTISSLLPLK